MLHHSLSFTLLLHAEAKKQSLIYILVLQKTKGLINHIFNHSESSFPTVPVVLIKQRDVVVAVAWQTIHAGTADERNRNRNRLRHTAGRDDPFVVGGGA